MTRTRVELVRMPPMLRDVVTAVVARDPDLELAGRPDGAHGPAADVVVTDMDAVEDDGLLRTLTARPSTRLVGISSSTGSATLYELRPRRVPLGVLGLQDLADVLAGRAHR